MAIRITTTRFTGHLKIGYRDSPVVPVDSVDAGEEQTVLCSSMIFLNGSVVGGQNNVFLWEQTSGTPVVIDDPTSLVTFFLNSGGDDLTFRLWVDQGLPSETYDDTNIVRTPLSNASMVTTEDSFASPVVPYDFTNPNWKYYSPARSITNITFSPDLENWPPPSDADDGLGCPDISVSDLLVSWNIPVDNYGVGTQTYIDNLLSEYKYAQLEKYNSTSMLWEVVDTYYGEDSPIRSAPIINGEVYRLGAGYRYSTPDYIQYTNTFSAVDDGSISYKTLWSNTRVDAIDQTGSYSVQRLSAVVLSYNSDNAINGVTHTGLGDITRLESVILPLNESNNNLEAIDHSASYSVTRTHGGNIGG